MKVGFVISNLHAVRMDLVHAQISSEPTRRAVTIDLTPEQIEQIGLRVVGVDRGEDRFEEITQVFIVDSQISD